MRNALGSPFNNCLKETKKKKRHWIKCEGGLCEGKISDQLTHQLAVAVIGESANEWRVTFSLKTEYTIMLWRARTTKESGKEKKKRSTFFLYLNVAR